MEDICATKYLISLYSLISKIILDCVHINTHLCGFIIPSPARLWEEFKNKEESAEKGSIKLRRTISVVLVVQLEENLKDIDHLGELDIHNVTPYS